MTRFLTLLAVAAAFCVGTSEKAEAQFPAPFGFQAYGFYQPYGIQYTSATPTPPYFALNPPVYYSTRYARPYGISPFASPPVVSAPGSYKARLESNFYNGTPRSGPASSPRCNPCVHVSQAKNFSPTSKLAGKVKTNPFFEPTERIAAR